MLLRWAPAAVAAVACLTLFVGARTPLSAVSLYSLYLLVFAAVPGTLLWRLLRTHPLSFLEEVVAGTTLGLCVQTFLAWLLTPLGMSRLAPLWIVLVLGASVIHPRLRGLWRSQAERVTPVWMGWALAGICAVACWWVANNDWRGHPVVQIPGMPGQWYAVAPQTDTYFQQAITAAVRHGATHFPNVAASPLNYELMVSYHMADAARWTGVDLTLLVQRLQPFPVLILAVLLCAVIAYRITVSPWGAVLGAGFGYLTNPPPLWVGTRSPFTSVGSLNLGLSRSATYSFGQPVLLLTLLLVIVILGRKRLSVPQILAFALVAFVAGSAKGTLLPQIVCGLAAVLVIGWFLRARRSARVLLLLGGAAVLLLAAMHYVLGSASRDLKLSIDVNVTHWTAFGALLHTADAAYLSPVKAVFVATGWFLGVAASVIAVVVKRRDLGVWLLAGIGLSGIGGAIVFSHPSLSQIWFLRGSWPILGTLAGIGVYEAARKLRTTRRVALVVVAAALAAGLGASLLVRSSFQIPTVYVGQATWARLFAPYAVLIVIALVLGVLAALVLRRLRADRQRTPFAAAAAVCLLVAAVAVQGSGLLELTDKGLAPLPQSGTFPVVDPNGAYVARWVRDHSAVDATIATNMHCVFDTVTPTTPARPRNATCDAQHFWLAALSERQVLLEGWSYAPAPAGTDPAFSASLGRSRMWDPQFLVDNDAAMTQPTSASMQWLRSHSVGWIVVDRAILPESPRLKDYADLVLVRGSFAVYRVPAAA